MRERHQRPAPAGDVRQAGIISRPQLRMTVWVLSGVLLWTLLPGCASAPEPPRAARRPVELQMNGDVRVDDYFWLRDREDPEVLSYLEAENAYTDAVMSHTEDLQDELHAEIKGREKQDDSSVPYRLDGYYYYRRYEAGKQYPLHCRKADSLEAPEEIMIDVNELAAGHDYCAVRGLAVSPQRDILGYGVDYQGRRFYTLRFKNLTTGELYPDRIPDVTGNLAWANDNRTVFYSRQDLQTLRPYQIYRHVLGTDPAGDALVYEEPDETFRIYVFKTKSKRFLMIGALQTLSTEYRYLRADTPDGEWRVIQPRERDHEYSVDHLGGEFIIRTNWQAENFRLMRAPVDSPGKENWQEVIPQRQDVLLEDFEVFRHHVVLSERQGGLVRIRVLPWPYQGGDPAGRDHYLEFAEPAYAAWLSANPELDTNIVRFVYSSLTTPNSTYDYDMDSHERTLLKQEEVLGGYDPAAYRVERLTARAADGTGVPISLVYRLPLQKDGSRPLLLYGYGSYGYSTDADFDSPMISLLDRGFIYAIAHVRGGEELGRRWYEDGKLLHKKNTFTDFIACGEHLVQEGYTSPERLFAWGGSAGGLLMGAVSNMAPRLFCGIVAEVPWVDVVTTMLDASIPLTTNEYDEWGNPQEEQYYDYMLSYSPYDNVGAHPYPNMLVTTGLHDSQVQYWEPAKWVAKLRALKTGDGRLLLRTNMSAGHGGASGRYERYREKAFIFAFLLDLAGQAE
jgi:oligopeptidase B